MKNEHSQLLVSPLFSSNANFEFYIPRRRLLDDPKLFWHNASLLISRITSIPDQNYQLKNPTDLREDEPDNTNATPVMSEVKLEEIVGGATLSHSIQQRVLNIVQISCRCFSTSGSIDAGATRNQS